MAAGTQYENAAVAASRHPPSFADRKHQKSTPVPTAVNMLRRDSDLLFNISRLIITIIEKQP
jgi:hypothetical protein